MHHAIRVRRVSFDWTHTPRHWVPNDPFTTHLINVLHLLLPAGEKWFVNVYRQALPLIDDTQLRGDVRGFMGQEAVHSRAHAAVLEHLAAQGIDTNGYTSRIEWMFDRLLGDLPRLPAWLQRRWLIARLAIIAAIEHFTCVLGWWVLRNKGLERAGADPTMLDLLRWHGAEEVEHRSVAFDLFEQVNGNYVRRVIAMIGVFPVLVGAWVLGVRHLMANDPSSSAKPRWRYYRQAAADDRVPGPRELLTAVPRYLKVAHHPSHEASTAAALDYLAISPAARAAGY